MKWADVPSGQHESTHLSVPLSLSLHTFTISSPDTPTARMPRPQDKSKFRQQLLQYSKVCFMKIIFSKWTSMGLRIYRRSSLRFKFTSQKRLYPKSFNGTTYSTFQATVGICHTDIWTLEFSSMSSNN
jgi:hypothetical protein